MHPAVTIPMPHSRAVSRARASVFSRIAAATAFAALVTASGASAGSCVGDLDGDGVVGSADLGVIFGNFGSSGGDGDINGDGIVDGIDLGMMLSHWGVCELPCEGYTPMDYFGAIVGGFNDPLPLVVINGSVAVSPSGVPEGLLFANFEDGGAVQVEMALSYVSLFVDGSFVSLPPDGPPSLAVIDGTETTIAEMLKAFDADLASGTTPGNWSVAGRAMLALAALVETHPFCCNLKQSLKEASPTTTPFWCKVGVGSISANIVATAQDGCGDLDDGCGSPGGGQVGQLEMPCFLLSSLCFKEQFAGAQATFEAALSLWEGQ